MVLVSVCAAAASMAWHSGFVRVGWRVEGFHLAVVSGAPAAVAKKIKDASEMRDVMSAAAGSALHHQFVDDD